MSPHKIFQEVSAGNIATYRVRILRGYLHGYRSVTFRPGDSLTNIKHRLQCFRFDEKPYDNAKFSLQKPERQGSKTSP